MAAARESAAEVLQLAGRVWPEQSAAAVIEGSNGSERSTYADWEVFQAELLSASSSDCSPAASSGCCWGEGLWCFNPACTNLEGPSELALKTHACGGGCGVRYCSPECQAQGWRDGHSLESREAEGQEEGGIREPGRHRWGRAARVSGSRGGVRRVRITYSKP